MTTAPQLAVPPAHPRRVVYLGTPEMAVPPLEALHEAGFEIALVVTGVDKRRGRGGALSPTPVAVAAGALGLPISHELADVSAVGAELGVVVAYGHIIPTSVLAVLPMVNVHFSLLPRWRGAAPVERAILAGDGVTGVCVMAVEPELDTGAVYGVTELPIGERETAAQLRGRLVAAGSALLVATLQEGLTEPRPQAGDVTYAAKLTAEDLRLDWARSAEELARVVRVGGAWTTVAGRRLKVWDAVEVATPGLPSADHVPGELALDDGEVTVAAGSGSALALRAVQPEGRSRMDADAWARGLAGDASIRLGG